MHIPAELSKLDNPHIEAARCTFVQDLDFGSNPPLRYIFICFTNRSGSNYLAETLASGGLLNLGGEYFNGDTIREVCNDRGIRTLPGYLAFLRVQESMGNALVSKIAITQLALLHEYGFLQGIEKNVKYVFIKRNDILSQAISTQIAFRTLRWTSLAEGTTVDVSGEYSTNDIRMTVDDIAFQNFLWERFFSHNAIDVTHVTYEHLVREPGHVLNDIFRDLKLPAIYDLEKVKLRRQTGEINRKWRESYRLAMTGHH